MAVIRALGLILALAGFFLIGTPLQWLIGRLAPRLADRIPIVFCRTLLWLLGVRVSIEGTHARGAPVLAVANHVSWIDILALGSVMPFAFLAKSDIAGWPILSAFAQVQGTVFVDRKRRRTILSANRQMAERLAQGRTVLLFPEGTTTAGPEPGRFHASHIAAARDLIRRDAGCNAVDVQPIAVGYSSKHAAWIGDDDLVPHVWRTLRAPRLLCTLSFGTPIPFRAESDRKSIAATARAFIADKLARPATEAESCLDFDLDCATTARV